MSVSAFEQEFIYLLNRARHDPVAYQAERGLSINLSSITPRQPLALNLQLAAAGKFKSDEMATLNYFAHTSVTGETPNALVRRFGYDLPERVSVGDTTYLLPTTGNMVESLHGGRTTPAAALQSLIESTGHRNHLLGVTAHNQVAKEVGIGYRFSSQARYRHYWTVLITPSNETQPLLTGVAFADGNNNNRFEGVEGLGNVTVTASGSNGNFTTTTGMTGGWALSVPSGEYVVTASGGGFSGTSSALVHVDSQNVAIDFVSGSSAAWVNFVQSVASVTIPTAPTSVSATAGNAQASLTWTAPSSNGGASITNYIVQYSSDSGSTWTTFSRAASTVTSATVTGLTNGAAYVFRVAAVNSVGTGAFSSQTAPLTVSTPSETLILTAQETHLLYLVNRTRQFPEDWATRLSVSLSADERGPFAPLVANESLMEAARLHSQDMLSRGVLTHSGSDGSSVGQRAVRAGYPTNFVSENVYFHSNGGNSPLQDVAPQANDAWFTSTTGHRQNMLNAEWTEIGTGFAAQQGSSGFLPQYGTEVFGRYNTGPFLTGVAFHDLNENRFYEAGEGVGGVTVTVTGGQGETFVTTTAPAGGWALSVPSGDYVVTASGGGFSGTSSAPVRVGSQNVAVDFISGSSAASVSFIPHVNSAPVLMTDEDRFFAPVIAGTQNPRGQTVGNLLGTDFTDVDPLSPSGIAVTATTVASGGSWQFSIDGGGSWQSLGTPSTGAARLLRSTDMLRFVPGDSAPATASLSYRAWDQATGSAGGVADVSSAGGSTAFSTATATATVHVVSSNTAPVLSSAGTNPFHSVAEDTAHPSGSPVRHLVGSGFSDPDPGTPVGIAVIDATEDTNGDWQYSLDEGATWSVLGAVSNGASLLLSGSSRLRFLPAANYNGTVTLSYRAWDASTGGAGDRVDLSDAAAVGGSTGFSSEAVTASLTVTPVNDAPVFIADASALRLRPVPANATQNEALAIGTRVGDLLGNAHQDIDASALRGIAIIGTGGNGTFWWNTGSGGWSGIAAGPHFATLLRDTDYIYFSPSSGFSGTSTITFRLWDQTSGTRGWNGADLSNPETSTGGSTAFGTEILEARVFVGAAGTPPSATFGNPTRDESGRVVASIPLSLARAVSGLDSGDLTLSRDGTPVALLGARVEGSSTSFTVAGLEDATTIPGTYILRLVAAGSGITDEAGNPLSGDASVTFVVAGNQTTTPSAPTNLSATAGDAQASLTWTAPSPSGGASITDYIVQYSSDSGSTWTTFDRAASTATSATVTGLTNGAAYVFRVAAVNSVGTGAYSVPSTALVLNQAPTDIALSETTIVENAGANALVGTLSTTDPDTSNTFTYRLVTGAGSTDNAAFNIVGNQLRATAGLDYESKSSYSVRVRSTDQAGLFTEKAFAISVIDVNEAPTAVLLTPATRTLPDNAPTGERFKLADITVIDDGLGSNALALGGDDADTFELIGTELYLKAGVRLDGLSKPTHVVIVEARDATLPGSPQSAQFTLSVVARVVEVADGQVVADTTVRTGDYRMVKRGLGTLSLDLANTHAGGTIVEAGEVIVRNPLSLGSGSLVVQAGAKLRLDIGTGRVSLPALTLAGTGTLDLGTGSLLISAGGFDLVGLRESIISGRNNGTWSGRGITSSGIEPGTSREVGYRVLQDGSLLVGYSAVGDTNMDGSVNIQDLIDISTSGRYGSGSADAAWWQGDFNYDGVVNITDLINLSTSGLYGAGSYMPVTAAGAVSPQPWGSSFGSPLAGLTATPTGHTAPADLEPAAASPAIESADQMTTTPSSPRQAPGSEGVGRLAWSAVANQGVLESPKDAKASRWRLVAR